MKKICPVCKKSFDAGNSNRKYCDRECARTRNAQMQSKYNETRRRREQEQRKVKPVKRMSNKELLHDTAMRAREAGMSYGQFVAKYGG